ncbi:MAG: response regulator transcription factor [Gammaproteobacteria bacterium]
MSESPASQPLASQPLALQPTVFIVDDDPAIRESLALLMASAGLEAQCFESAQAFLGEHDEDAHGCVVTDLKMPGMTGLELQEQLQARAMALPVIVLTGHGEVSEAVRAMKRGAIDFIQKPFDPAQLLEDIRSAIARDATARTEHAQVSAARKLLSELTDREREVMALVTQGNANKVIAHELDISERTVELHRSRAMKKTGSRSLADLMRIARLANATSPGAS